MRICITAGPTREPIDAVRFISNRSSGRLGADLARAAVEAGHQVTLLLGPGLRRIVTGARIERFESAADLERLLETHFPDCDVLIMAAAVADFRPSTSATGKLPMDKRPQDLHLEPTPDLAALMVRRRRADQRVIAFALEQPDQLHKRANQKLAAKGVDAIVANSLATMDSDRIDPVWLTATGTCQALGRMSKRRFARWLIGELARPVDHHA